jgi:hypothetical protein
MCACRFILFFHGLFFDVEKSLIFSPELSGAGWFDLTRDSTQGPRNPPLAHLPGCPMY